MILPGLDPLTTAPMINGSVGEGSLSEPMIVVLATEMTGKWVAERAIELAKVQSAGCVTKNYMHRKHFHSQAQNIAQHKEGGKMSAHKYEGVAYHQ